MVSYRTLTSAMRDTRDFLIAERRAEDEVLPPAGLQIAVTGGRDFNDRRLIWDKLHKVHAHPGMVLWHGGSPKGAERIAARRVDHRKVPQIALSSTAIAGSVTVSSSANAVFGICLSRRMGVELP